ncbi:MAG: flagellar hook assembly protein FlgD [Kineosporiaceae bacterium]
MTVQPTPIDRLTAPAPAPVTAGRSELGREDFLQLLVAQLRYQDPLNPADGTEFVAQTAQLTSVERLNELADLSGQAVSVQQRWSAAALVGRTVTVPGPDGIGAVTGTVTSVLLSGTDPVLRVRVPGGDTRDVPLDAVTAVSDGTPPA